MWWMANSVLHELALGRARACVRAPTKPHDAKMRWAGWPIRDPLIIAGTDLAARWKSWKATWGISQGSSELVSPCHLPLDHGHQETAAPQHFQGTLLVTILGDVLLPGMTDNVMEGMLFKESWDSGVWSHSRQGGPGEPEGVPRQEELRGISLGPFHSALPSSQLEKQAQAAVRAGCEQRMGSRYDCPCATKRLPQSTPGGVGPLSRNAWSSALCSVGRARPHPRAKRAKPPPQNRPTCRGSYDSRQALGTLLCLCLLIVIQLIAQNKSIADPDNPTPPDDARFVGHAAVRHPFENGPLICAQLSRGPASHRSDRPR